MILVALAAVVAAQAPSSSAPDPVSTPAVNSVSAPACCRLAALTPVELTLLEEVSSKTAVNGMAVHLSLAKPLYVTNTLGFPAGTPVDGVVLHAAKKGMAGKPGELLLSARSILLADGSEIRLRSFKLAPARGKNNETLANATTVAVGLVGLLITGGSATAPSGATASAKTAEDIVLPMASLSVLAALPAMPPLEVQPTVTQGEMK